MGMNIVGAQLSKNVNKKKKKKPTSTSSEGKDGEDVWRKSLFSVRKRLL
jgi:hypothetical protein